MKPTDPNIVYEQIRSMWSLCVPVDEIARSVKRPKRVVVAVIQSGQARKLDQAPRQQDLFDGQPQMKEVSER